jgi:hypothetical protein
MTFLVSIFPTTPGRWKIVFTLAEKLLRQDYIIGLDNYCSSPELFDMRNEYETDVVGTVRTNRKELPRHHGK